MNSKVTISQSTTILRYLSDKLPTQVDEKWYPRNLEQRAKVDEFVDFFHFSMNAVSNITQFIYIIFVNFKEKI